MGRSEESISGQCNHQVPSTVYETRKLAAKQDKEEDTEKNTEKTQRRKEKTSNFFSDEAKFRLQTSPRQEDIVFYWFQTSPEEVRPRSQTLPLMSCSPVRAIQNLYFFFDKKTSKKMIFVPQKTFFVTIAPQLINLEKFYYFQIE